MRKPDKILLPAVSGEIQTAHSTIPQLLFGYIITGVKFGQGEARIIIILIRVNLVKSKIDPAKISRTGKIKHVKMRGKFL